jgi:hypothetical protein
VEIFAHNIDKRKKIMFGAYLGKSCKSCKRLRVASGILPGSDNTALITATESAPAWITWRAFA